MSSICSDAAQTIPVALLTLTLFGCATEPATRYPRPTMPVPTDVVARYAIPGAVEERSIVPIGGTDTLRYFRGRIRAGEELAEFWIVEPATDRQHSFILALPILAGGEDLMWFVALDLAERGYAVAWPRRVASALARDQRGPDLELLFRRSVIHARMVLTWARQQPSYDPGRMGLVGISLGSMIGSAVMAVEPELKAGALCLAGGDLPDMLLVTDEPRAIDWVRERIEDDGIARVELRRELDRSLTSDPALLAGYLATDKVLLVSAQFDSVVPRRHQDLLWESLGRPERLWVPFGHYTAALALPTVLDAIEAFFAARDCASLSTSRPSAP